MTFTETLRKFVLDVAGADLCGIAPASRFDKDDPIFKIYPEVKSVIAIGFRILRGAVRGIEEGTTYYQYTTMAIECLEETVMPCAAIQVANFLEDNGYVALPQRKHQHFTAETEETNPEILHDYIRYGETAEVQMNVDDAAVKCGLGEKGLHGRILCDEFGPLLRYQFILTNAELDANEMYTPHLCDKCGECVKACPGKAIAEDGKVNTWQCAAYYAGANGTKNPFMQPTAYADFDNRLDIIAGEAKVDKELCGKILDATVFYPPIGKGHAYRSSICGKACDTACYIHLEEKGVLTKKFKEKFRKRPEWKFDISDFDVIKK
ncbi:MAG: 4Fe-4S binding protein [Clostridia bacterium]|nr:4Fe-4S binding protein [Clostridia bacterium]